MELEQALTILESLFELPKPRRQKCEALYRLAREAKGGAIVELGTAHGNGAITLALGSRDGNGCPVYTVDDFQERQGWANEPYGPDDELTFWANVAKVGVEVNQVKMDVKEAARAWDGPISLLHWDLGMFSRLMEDFELWRPHINGTLAVHDTFDRRLGSKEMDRVLGPGVHWGGGVWSYFVSG